MYFITSSGPLPPIHLRVDAKTKVVAALSELIGLSYIYRPMLLSLRHVDLCQYISNITSHRRLRHQNKNVVELSETGVPPSSLDEVLERHSVSFRLKLTTDRLKLTTE